MFSRPNYRELAAQLSTELDQSNQLLQIERAKRISAEAIAEERRQQLEKAWEIAHDAQKSRDEAVMERLKSTDLVNTALLSTVTPEKQTTKTIQEFQSISRKPRVHSQIEKYVDNHIAALKQKIAKAQQHPAPKVN